MKALILVSILVLTGCAEKDIETIGGYRFVELSRGNGAIVNREGEFIVYPNVVRYREVGKYIVGERVLAVDNLDPEDDRFTSGLGSFILDATTGQLRQGISQRELERALNRTP